VFCEQIRWVSLAVDLAEVDATAAHGLLYPQHVRVKVADTAQPLT